MVDNKSNIQGEWFKLLKKLGIPIIIIVLGIVAIVWWLSYVNRHLDRIENIANERRELNANIFEEIQNRKKMGIQMFGGVSVLTNEDLYSIKKTIYYLKDEVDKAIELSRRETTAIVDRVNLYITIGIVLLTLLGVFVPVIVQNFGSDDTRERHKELKREIEKGRNEFSRLLKNAEKKITKETQGKVQDLENRIDDSNKAINSMKIEVMNIPPLRLSYSILRALDKNLIKWYIKKPSDTRIRLKEIFEHICKDLESCRSENILSSNNEILKKSLRDFNYHLKDILFTFQGERIHLEKFSKLKNSVESYINNEDSERARSIFDEVIDDVKHIAQSIVNEQVKEMT